MTKLIKDEFSIAYIVSTPTVFFGSVFAVGRGVSEFSENLVELDQAVDRRQR